MKPSEKQRKSSEEDFNISNDSFLEDLQMETEFNRKTKIQDNSDESLPSNIPRISNLIKK